jgi:hypothetical protein
VNVCALLKQLISLLMKQIISFLQRNPEINHMLNNPELLRQTMEMARNPSMLQELMRTQDRALSNLESIPGGYSALQRMYRDIQEPMLNAATQQFSRNPYESNSSGGNPGRVKAPFRRSKRYLGPRQCARPSSSLSTPVLMNLLNRKQPLWPSRYQVRQC